MSGSLTKSFGDITALPILCVDAALDKAESEFRNTCNCSPSHLLVPTAVSKASKIIASIPRRYVFPGFSLALAGQSAKERRTEHAEFDEDKNDDTDGNVEGNMRGDTTEKTLTVTKSTSLLKAQAESVLTKGFGVKGTEYETRSRSATFFGRTCTCSKSIHFTHEHYATHPSSQKHILHVRHLAKHSPWGKHRGPLLTGRKISRASQGRSSPPASSIRAHDVGDADLLRRRMDTSNGRKREGICDVRKDGDTRGKENVTIQMREKGVSSYQGVLRHLLTLLLPSPWAVWGVLNLDGVVATNSSGRLV
ncbi:hypothetical protein DFH29DRAFT_1072933 [Suillus ampliporus]|nr:hypothetical protein DFH29DRAFT_1072933 [Suillus ampliporus]